MIEHAFEWAHFVCMIESACILFPGNTAQGRFLRQVHFIISMVDGLISHVTLEEQTNTEGFVALLKSKKFDCVLTWIAAHLPTVAVKRAEASALCVYSVCNWMANHFQCTILLQLWESISGTGQSERLSPVCFINGGLP